jgi:tRNA nucleotidyltransferase (CCA-adding enzyme)
MPDYMYMLESRLSAEQHAALVRIQELAVATESNLYLTGGAVRDLISGMPIRDLDFTIEGNPSRIARELEKGGARIAGENEPVRQIELILAGDVGASIAAARDEAYAYPGTRPEIRFSTIMDDLRRRDFSLNAIAISLNPNSRGLLLDPTNGQADLERREIRALSIHSFTNQPVRLLRALRYAVRMGFKLEQRTSEWMRLAIDRGLHANISGEDAGNELRQLAREEKPGAILKVWQAQNLLGGVHPLLAKRRPDYEAIERIVRVRDDMSRAGFRPRLFIPVMLAVLGRLKQREQSAVLSRMEMSTAEMRALHEFEWNVPRTVKMLASRKTAAPRDAFAFLEKVPMDLLAYLLAESSNSKVSGKIRTFLFKWKPLHQGLPSVAAELESLGLEHGPKFDKVMADFFQAQLLGRARKPEEHVKLLRKLAGIKEPPKKPEKEERKKAEKPTRKSGIATSAESASPKKVSRPESPSSRKEKLVRESAPGKSRQSKMKSPAAGKKPVSPSKGKAKARAGGN